MPARSNVVIQPTFNLAKSGTQIIDVDFDGYSNIKLMTLVQYASSASTTNVSLSLIQGFNAGADPTAIGSVPTVFGGSLLPTFATNTQTVTMATVATSQTVAQKIGTSFYLATAAADWTRWVRLTFVNLDATNSCNITLYGEVG